jgi:four helix bundle protein
MSDFAQELKSRTKQFALRIVKVVQALGEDKVSTVLGKQLLRSGTSVGANYRAACRARSSAEFCSKLGIVEEECDESIYWMELIVETGLLAEQRLIDLIQEANEILSIVIASINTSKRNK